jgi:hypothetical protein
LKFWFFLVLFMCQVWLQNLSKIFDLQSSCYLLLHSSHHLESTGVFLIFNNILFSQDYYSFMFIIIHVLIQLSLRWNHIYIYIYAHI